MKKITLFCGAGMSTSILVKRMRNVAAKEGKDYDINAFAMQDLEKGFDSDVILIGPQIRYAIDSVRKRFPDIPVDSIPMRMYGIQDAPSVIAIAEKLMAEAEEKKNEGEQN